MNAALSSRDVSLTLAGWVMPGRSEQGYSLFNAAARNRQNGKGVPEKSRQIVVAEFRI